MNYMRELPKNPTTLVVWSLSFVFPLLLSLTECLSPSSDILLNAIPSNHISFEILPFQHT
jgi:hypothetical protein